MCLIDISAPFHLKAILGSTQPCKSVFRGTLKEVSVEYANITANTKLAK